MQDRPHLLAKSDMDLVVRLISACSDNHLPIVYVSADFDSRPCIDVGRIAKLLSGMAHVLVEPDRHFSVQLAKRVSSENAYGGAVGIYWPLAHENSVRLLPRNYKNTQELEQDLEKRIRSAWLFAKTSRGCSWTSLREVTSAKNIKELRERGTASVDDYIKAFDEEIAALIERSERAEAKNKQLHLALQQAQAKAAASQSGILSLGKEQEFYSGEFLDALLATIEEDLEGVSSESRRAIILSDILSANKTRRTGTPEICSQRIKECLSTAQQITSREINSLTSIGFTITDDGKHYKMIFAEDPRFTFSAYKTASDHRSGKNLASQIIKRLFKR